MATKRKKKPARKKRASRRGASNSTPQAIDDNGNYSVLVELRQASGQSPAFAATEARELGLDGFELDEEFEPVSLFDENTPEDAFGFASNETYVVRGTVSRAEQMEELRALPQVAEVWPDTPIAPFNDWDPAPDPTDSPAAAPCPIPPCDCSPGTPQGTIADVANYLGVNQIWTNGIRGTGIVVGVLDSGITAQGRPVKAGETNRRIPRVIDGWPSDWGTESGRWGDHGNMCATDVLGMAPDCQLYDFRISGSGGSPGTISRALQAFNWAINRHRTDGTPHVLTNSWGIFQETWDSTYARNPNHPFTRKVVEAINEGILVLFAAGNCGDTCPDGRCGSDIGPGRSIWGANGHPKVMTVGAVNRNEQFIGYSSRGPAALDPNKPDFCSISHFTGYNNSDSGTSAATPICAGVVALLKQAKPSLSQDQAKSCLKSTAKDIGPSGFDQHSGAGIIQGLAAYRCVSGPIVRPTLVGPRCVRQTLIPACRPRLTLTGPGCVRPTLVPPRCPRQTISGPLCPRRTLIGPGCFRQTLVGPRCPRITFTVTCPRPTMDFRCPRPTVLTCPRPTLAGCPRPTFSAAMCTPPPLSGYDDGAEYWYGYEDYADGADYADWYEDPAGYEAGAYDDAYSDDEWYGDGEYSEGDWQY